MPSLLDLLSLLWPFLTGAALMVAWQSHRRMREAARYIAMLEEQNKTLGAQMMEVAKVAAQHGEGVVTEIRGGDTGFTACIHSPEGHQHYSYNVAEDKFFEVGADENFEINPADDDCDVPLPIRDILLQSKVEFLEMLKAKRGSGK